MKIIKFYRSVLVGCMITGLLSSCATRIEEKPYTGRLVAYSSPNVIGYENKPILVDASFLPVMDKLSEYAEQNGLILYVTSSFRKQNQAISNAIVPPATKSNHLAGHAVDINIVYNDRWYESKDLKKANFDKLPPEIKNFFAQIMKTPGMRWGGNFQPEDPIHIDDALNTDHPDTWKSNYKSFQN